MASVERRYSKKSGKLIGWRLRAELGRNNGKRVVLTQTVKVDPKMTPGKQEKELKRICDNWEAELTDKIRRGELSPDGKEIVREQEPGEKTFKQFIEEDFFALHNTELKPSTREFYKNISVRPLAYLGDKELSKITSLDIETLFAQLRETEYKRGKKSPGKHLSPKTLRHIYTFLTTAFGFAERHDLIAKNPVKRVKPPKVETKPVDHFTTAEAKSFIAALDKAPLRWQALMQLLITTGIRRGEAAGLRWEDIDFDSLTMKIQRNVFYIPKEGVKITEGNEPEENSPVGTPKTASSFRDIHIHATVAALLKKWRAEQAAPHGGSLIKAYCFADSPDPFTPPRPDSITRWLKKFEEENGFRSISPHDLRHTAATLMISNGEDVKTVQGILGHKDAETTLNFYVAPIRENTDKAVDNLGAVLGL